MYSLNHAMSDVDHARLAAIEQEFLDMGASRELVESYVKASCTQVGVATAWPRHNGMMMHIPTATVPHLEYARTLEALVDDIRDARKVAIAAERAIEEHKAVAVNKCITNQDLQQRIALYERQVLMPKVKVHALYTHLTKSKPIDAAAYFKRLDTLINEKIDIMVNIRIVEGSNMECHHDPPNILDVSD